MKRTLFFLILVIGVAGFQAANSQIRKIPSTVTESFKNKYPDAANVEWKDNISNFKAVFERGGHKSEAKFDNDGKWENTETRLNVTDLPSEVKSGFNKSKYTDWAITELYKIELPEKTQFRIHIKKRSVQKKNLLFSGEGQLISDNITL